MVIENNKYTSGEDFRAALTQTLVCFQENANKYPKLGWLADTGNAEVFPDEDIAWVNNVLNPQMYAAGVRYISFVVHRDVFAGMGVQEYSENTDPNAITVRHFDNKADARAWLTEIMQ
ncbi:MAG: hypothetical protein HC913_23355 [Microscillaceae bacterium]|nr:hypothetical protein [Microscillaceae bacterium]